MSVATQSVTRTASRASTRRSTPRASPASSPTIPSSTRRSSSARPSALVSTTTTGHPDSRAGHYYAAVDSGAFALAPAVPMVMKNAQIQGCQTTLRSRIGGDTIARSLSSKAAFKKATLPVIEANLEAHTLRLEMALLYGHSATGQGQTNAAGGTAVDATHYKISFSAATWAIGLWGGMEVRRSTSTATTTPTSSEIPRAKTTLSSRSTRSIRTPSRSPSLAPRPVSVN